MAQVALNSVDHALTAKVIQGLADREDFVGLQVAPGLGQQSLSVNYPVISLIDGNMLRSDMEPRTPGTKFKQVTASIGLDESKLSGDGVDVIVPLEVVKEAEVSGLDALAVYGEEAFLNGLRLHESRVATLTQGSGFSTANSVVAYTQGNIDTINIALDIQNAIRRVKRQSEKANSIYIPAEVWDRVRFSSNLRDFIAGAVNPGAMVSPENLQKAFAVNGIQKVEVCEAYVNTASKRKENTEQVWSNSHIWVGATDVSASGADSLGGSRTLRSAMKTFFWDEIFGAPFVVKMFYNEDIESHIVRVWGFTNEKIVNARAGTRITTQFA